MASPTAFPQNAPLAPNAGMPVVGSQQMQSQMQSLVVPVSRQNVAQKFLFGGLACLVCRLAVVQAFAYTC